MTARPLRVRPGVTLPTPATATPLGARRARIARLEDLITKARLELARERAALERLSRPPDRGTVPPGIDPAAVRAWARRNGWPDLGDRGRIPAHAISAYLTAHRQPTGAR